MAAVVIARSYACASSRDRSTRVHDQRRGRRARSTSTATRRPASSGCRRARRRQSSPLTKTRPPSRTTPCIADELAAAPTATGRRRTWTTLRRRSAQKPPISTVIATTSGSETWYGDPAGRGTAVRRARSRIAISPPTVSAPWLGTMGSSDEEGRRRAAPAASPAHADRQHREAEEREHEADAPSAPGRMTPGVEDLEPIPAMPARKSSEMMFGSISVERNRVHEADMLDVVDLRAGECASVKPVRRRSCSPSICCRAAPGSVGAISVDHVQPSAPRSAVRFDALRTAASAHATLRPWLFASAAQRRRRVVHDLAPQVAADVLAARVDRRRRADVRLRRHREHVGRLGDPDAGRGCARAVGRDVDDHRDLRRELASARSCASSPRARRACRARSRPRRSRRRSPGRAGSFS